MRLIHDGNPLVRLWDWYTDKGRHWRGARMATLGEVCQMLEAAGVLERLMSVNSLVLMDERYLLPTEDQVRAFLARTYTDRRQYKANTHDCNAFAFALKGKACDEALEAGLDAPLLIGVIGYQQPRRHAESWSLSGEGRFSLIEPQDDSIRRLGQERMIRLLAA